MMELAKVIRDIPDFPQKGILFRDITPVLQNAEALAESVNQFCDKLKGERFDYVVGPESRGFIFGVPVAYAMKKGFIPVRKPGKLPCEVISKNYDLEYGSNQLEMHRDALKPGDKVVVVDDLIATGGTTKAICELVEELGAEIVSLNFFIELTGLKGRELLAKYPVHSLIQY
ncbi:MAG: adenine phosphoribosyltransferase [Lachnospiraceae bacterium]|nr:adenine phosphoribosyltransferase [Lachnospiraceae bacterium]